MAHLTKPERYNIEDTNIALLGSNLEKRVREHAGDKESAWEDAGKAPGTEIWRVEKFKIKPWPEDRKGVFYNGDSYIVLHTYKKTPDSEFLSYDLHFWLGEETTQDEAGTAAYKTVELDDLDKPEMVWFLTSGATDLHGTPVQYREAQSYESPRFLSYFPQFMTLHGGVSSGFHHVSSPPPLDIHRLYHIKAVATGRGGHGGAYFITRQVKCDAASVQNAEGDVLVLDKGSQVWQFNRKGSAGKERFRGSEFARGIVQDRLNDGHFKSIDVKVFDEGGPGAGTFLADVGTDAATVATITTSTVAATSPLSLFRMSDATGAFTVEPVPSSPPRRTDLSSSDIFILDDSGNTIAPAIYVWIGKAASAGERRMGVQFAQRYLRSKEDPRTARISVVKVNEGRENETFLRMLEA